jgi:hypothetical protein
LRFEWELHDRVLLQFGVHTVDGFLVVQGDILRHLLDWARLAGPAAGKRHERPDLPLWAWLRRQIAARDRGVQGVVRGSIARRPQVDHRLRMTTGLVQSLAAALAVDRGLDRPVPFEEVLAIVHAELRKPAVAVHLERHWQRALIASLI